MAKFSGGSVAPGSAPVAPTEQLTPASRVGAAPDPMAEAVAALTAPEPTPAPVAPQYSEAAGQPVITPEGTELSEEQTRAIAQEELAKQADVVQEAQHDFGYQPNERAALIDQYQDLADPTTIGEIQRTAVDLAEILTEFPTTQETAQFPEGTTKLSAIQQTLGVSDQFTLLNAAVSSVAAIGVGAFPQEARNEMTQQEGFDEGDPFGLNTENEQQEITKGGIVADELAPIIGNMVNQRVNPIQVDPVTNEPLARANIPRQDIDLVGRMLLPEMERAGLLQKIKRKQYQDPNGDLQEKDNPTVDVYIAGPKGRELFMNARKLERERDPNSVSGQSQTVPVGETGWYSGALALARRGNIRRGTNKAQRSVKDIARYQRKAGQVPVFPNADMVALAGILDQLSQQGNEQAHAVLGVKPSQLGNEKVLADKLRDRARDLQSAQNNLAEGKSRYRPHFNDPSVNRIYDDSIDANFQRSKRHRNMYMAAQRNLVVPRHTTPKGNTNQLVSDAEARSFEDFVQTAYSRPWGPNQHEMSFLWTLSRNIHGADAETWTISRTLSELTEEKLNQAAEKGKAILDTIANPEGVQGAQPGSPEAVTQQKFSQILGELDEDNWGHVAQSYIDAYNYKTQPKFQPKALTSIDMKSAGRTFLAADVGNQDVLERTGILWEDLSNNDSVNPVGDPRSLFVEILPHAALDDIFDNPNDRADGQALIKHIVDASKNQPKYAKDLAKAVLLQTDYGKAANTHQANAYDFLQKYPDTEAKMKQLFPNESPVELLNKIYASTLRRATDGFQMSAPKQMAQALSFLGRIPSPTGYYGETMPFGFTTLQPSEGPALEFGDNVIPFSQEVADPAARGKFKEITVGDDSTSYLPPKGSAVTNAVGPNIGQYRESAVLADAVNMVNPNDNAVPEFFAPVFDNFVLDSTTALKYHAAANKATRSVMEWDIKGAYKKDFDAQIAEAFQELPPEVDLNDPLYATFLDALDTQAVHYERAQGRSLDARETEYNQRRIAFLQSMAKLIGYKRASKRGDSPLVVPKGAYRQAIQEWMAFVNFQNNYKRWLVDTAADRSKVINKVKNTKRPLYFLN